MAETEREKLLLRKSQIEARLKRLAVTESKQERKNDTRRKIIFGALAMEHAESNPDLADTMRKLLNRYVTRPQDRKLFGLSERETGAAGDGEPGLKESA